LIEAMTDHLGLATMRPLTNLERRLRRRWHTCALALGAAMVGVWLAAGLIHEPTSEHVRHGVEIERLTPSEL
jgi:hypothetical protein